jgi:hypothetical protein
MQKIKLLRKFKFDNAFIIGNPSQCIYINEAIAHHNIQDNYNLFFITSFQAGYIKQIIDLVDPTTYIKLIRLPNLVLWFWKCCLITRLISFIYAKYFYILQTRSNKVTNLVFLGNIEDRWMQAIANNTFPKSVIALDDGNATINTFEKLKKLEPFDYFKSNKNITAYFLRLKPLRFRLEDINFFSIYYDSDNIPKCIRIIPNMLNSLKQKTISKNVDESIIYIIGSPFVKLKMISLEKYMSLLKIIIETNSNCRIYYIKHRAEDNFQLKNAIVKSNEMPVELFLLSSPILPKKIVTFLSSAAITLLKILDNRIIIENFGVIEHSEPIINYFKKNESDTFQLHILEKSDL